MKMQSVLKIMFPNKHYHYLISTWKESVRKCNWMLNIFWCALEQNGSANNTDSKACAHWPQTIWRPTCKHPHRHIQIQNRCHYLLEQRAGESTWAQQPGRERSVTPTCECASASIPELFVGCHVNRVKWSPSEMHSALQFQLVHISCIWGRVPFMKERKKTRSQSGGCITEFSRMYVPLFFPTHSVWLTCAGERNTLHRLK